MQKLAPFARERQTQSGPKVRLPQRSHPRSGRARPIHRLVSATAASGTDKTIARRDRFQSFQRAAETATMTETAAMIEKMPAVLMASIQTIAPA